MNSDVNTVIYGVTHEDATEVSVTVRGEAFIRDVRESGGYLILLPEEGLTPDAITDVRVMDENGVVLNAPAGITGLESPIPLPTDRFHDSAWYATKLA